MAKYNFDDDLEIAKKTELYVAKSLEKMGAEIVSMGKTKDGDILAIFPNGEKCYVEIKEDFEAHRTNNVPLEFQSRNKPSGIMTTKSKYWIYKIFDKEKGDKYIFFTASRLRTLIEKMLFKRIVNGGDKDSNTMMFLFPLSVFEEYGRMLEI